MARITLDTLVLSDAVNPADTMVFPLMSRLTVTPRVDGEIRTRATGRRVSVSRPGIDRKIDVTLPHCDRTQVEWVERMTGRTLLVRDDRGRKLYGICFEPVIDEIGYLREANVEMSLQQVTQPEGFTQAADGSWGPVMVNLGTG